VFRPRKATSHPLALFLPPPLFFYEDLGLTPAQTPAFFPLVFFSGICLKRRPHSLDPTIFSPRSVPLGPPIVRPPLPLWRQSGLILCSSRSFPLSLLCAFGPFSTNRVLNVLFRMLDFHASFKAFNSDDVVDRNPFRYIMTPPFLGRLCSFSPLSF